MPFCMNATDCRKAPAPRKLKWRHLRVHWTDFLCGRYDRALDETVRIPVSELRKAR